VAEGIFALLGVVVGGLIAAGTGYWMERKREDREVQTAARRAYIDLYACYFSIRWALEQGGLVQRKEIGTRLGRYREHESTFVHLRIHEYLVVSRTVGQLWLFVEQAAAPRSPAMTEDVRRQLESLRQQTREAGDILLEVARRGPAHMWGQRRFREARRRVRPKRDEQEKSEILDLVQELVRLPPIPEPDSGDHNGPERPSPDVPRSA
jgi:hypothetical protein